MATVHKQLALLKLQPTKLITRYNNGEFNSCTLSKQPLERPSVGAITKRALSNDPSQPRYYYTDRMGSKIEVVTTNVAACEALEQGLPQPPGRCYYCTQDCTEPVGIPVDQNYHVELIDGVNRTFLVYWTEGRYCDFSCAYKHLTLTDPSDGHGRRALLVQLASHLGIKRLVAANDMELLDCNGGSLPPEEWRLPNYRYEEKRGIVMLPIKRRYLMIKDVA